MGELILDGTKVQWHEDRIRAWQRGERIAPITIDMALTQACNFRCKFCYATMQRQDEHFPITKEVMTRFLDDCAEIGVKAISLVSDGESTINPAYVHTIQYGKSKGIDMASGTNAYLLKEKKLREIMPHLTYLRVNITAGEPERYKQIMGVRDGWFEQVCDNIKTMRRLKDENGWACTIGMQMVCDPRYADQIMPLAKLGKQLRPDYLVIKHISDNETGDLGVDYAGYDSIEDLLRAAEAESDETYKVVVKWNKINQRGGRQYSACHGWPFIMQLSGSGVVTSCGMHFSDKYKRYHLGDIVRGRFKEIWESDAYWKLQEHLISDNFNAKKECGNTCLQDLTNIYLDKLYRGEVEYKGRPEGPEPAHVNFI